MDGHRHRKQEERIKEPASRPEIQPWVCRISGLTWGGKFELVSRAHRFSGANRNRESQFSLFS